MASVPAVELFLGGVSLLSDPWYDDFGVSALAGSLLSDPFGISALAGSLLSEP